jgi:hypothetical protein
MLPVSATESIEIHHRGTEDTEDTEDTEGLALKRRSVVKL